MIDLIPAAEQLYKQLKRYLTILKTEELLSLRQEITEEIVKRQVK